MNTQITEAGRKALWRLGVTGKSTFPLVPSLSIEEAPDLALSLPPDSLVTRARYLDAKALADALAAKLGSNTVGFALAITKNGRIVQQRSGGLARRPRDGSLPWSIDVRMNIASVSKLITSMAIVKLLAKRRMRADARIGPWLPAYWTTNAATRNVTFAELMTHTSGFHLQQQTGDSTLAVIKQQVAAGPGKKTYEYKNLNFALCRFLVATLNGDASPKLSFFRPGGPISRIAEDNLWDAIAINAYEQYVNKNIFTAAGVGKRGFASDGNGALAYSLPPGTSWDSGDWAPRAGSTGWRISVRDLLKVMSCYRRSGGIVSKARAKWHIENLFGIDGKPTVPWLGTVYWKNGRDGVPTLVAAGRFKKGLILKYTQKSEQAVALFLPRDYELAVFANSPYGKNDEFLADVVVSAVSEALVENDRLLSARSRRTVSRSTLRKSAIRH